MTLRRKNSVENSGDSRKAAVPEVAAHGPLPTTDTTTVAGPVRDERGRLTGGNPGNSGGKPGRSGRPPNSVRRFFRSVLEEPHAPAPTKEDEKPRLTWQQAAVTVLTDPGHGQFTSLTKVALDRVYGPVDPDEFGGADPDDALLVQDLYGVDLARGTIDHVRTTRVGAPRRRSAATLADLAEALDDGEDDDSVQDG